MQVTLPGPAYDGEGGENTPDNNNVVVNAGPTAEGKNESKLAPLIDNKQPLSPRFAQSKEKKHENKWSSPPLMSIMCVMIVLLFGAEIIGVMWVNMINSAVVSSEYLEEDVWIGWQRIQIWSIVSDDSDDTDATASDIHYDTRCEDDSDDSEGILGFYHWCKLEKKGNIWRIGSWIRLGVSFVLAVQIFMMERHCEETEEYKNIMASVVKNKCNWGLRNKLRKIFYRRNQCAMLVFLFCCLVYVACCAVSIYLWNNDNPIYDFDRVGWWASFYVVFGEGAIMFAMFVLLFCDCGGANC